MYSRRRPGPALAPSPLDSTHLVQRQEVGSTHASVRGCDKISTAGHQMTAVDVFRSEYVVV